MSRIGTITVTLEKDVSDEWANKLRESIKTMRGVLDVTMNELDAATYWAYENARRDLEIEIWDILHPKKK